MEIYISINGVLRNLIQKFDYLYTKDFIDNDPEEKAEDFEYRIHYPIRNDNLLNYFAFHSKTEFENYCFIEYPLEIFGHAGISYMTAFSDLNRSIYENKDINFTLIGVDELGKSKPSTLFFLSKNGFLGNNIKFILSKDIKSEWQKCDMWITDDKRIIDECPKNKRAIKFATEYNSYFTHSTEINNLTNIKDLCLTSWEKSTTSMWTKLLNNVDPFMFLNKLRTKNLRQKEV